MALKTIGIVVGVISLLLVLGSIVVMVLMMRGKKKGDKHENDLMTAKGKQIAADAAVTSAKILMTGLTSDIATLQQSKTSMVESLVMVDENIEISMLTKTPKNNYYKSGVGSCLSSTGDGQISNSSVGEAIDDCVANKDLGGHGPCVGVVVKSSSVNGGCVAVGASNNSNFHRLATAAELGIWTDLNASKKDLTQKIDQMDLEIVSRQAAYAASLKVAVDKQAESDKLGVTIKSLSEL